MIRAATIFLILAIIFTLVFCTWGIVRIVKVTNFELNCEAYIERAANASTVELAKAELAKAIQYAEVNGLTEGIVSIILKDPKNDVGFWYENMKSAYAELESLPEDTTSLEKTNVLMKLRESLTDTNDNGVNVIVPAGISIYPNNVMYFWWGMLSFLLALVFWILYAFQYAYDYY